MLYLLFDSFDLLFLICKSCELVCLSFVFSLTLQIHKSEHKICVFMMQLALLDERVILYMWLENVQRVSGRISQSVTSPYKAVI